MSNNKRGSSNGNKPPYLRLEKWADGTLAFWRKRNHDPNMRYNVDAYEAILREEIKHHKNFATLD